MRKDERTGLGLLLALVVVALIGVGYTMPWWSFEESTGRQNAPNGPVEERAVERADVDFYADRWEGDLEPTEALSATGAMQTIRVASYTAVGAMGLYLLGQIPGVSRIITRSWCMLAGTVAFAAVLVALYSGWTELPMSMAAKGVDGPFTSLLLENGYIRTNLNTGWVAAAFAAVAALGTVMAAYGAGDADPRVIEEYSAA